MKALVFGLPPDRYQDRGEGGDELDARLDSLPFGLREVDDARLVRPDWVITRPRLAGVCGSESKLVLGDFDTGDIDNPMAAFSSIPHIPGHEVVAEVVALGPDASGLEVGQRVLLNPWLTCGPRGIDPPCPSCQSGDLNLCWSFTSGALGPGVHVGVATDAPGGWADLMAAHDSMLIPIPDSVTDEVAVLADPFAVSMHAIVRHPPPLTGRALIYGAGALGVTSVAVLRTLYPEVEIGVVARFPAQAELATKLGASAGLRPRAPARSWSRRWPTGRAAFCTPPMPGCPWPIPAASMSSTTLWPGPRPWRSVSGSWPNGARSSRPASTPQAVGSTPLSTSRSCPWPAPTPSGSKRWRGCASMRSATISIWWSTAGSTSRGMLTHQFPLDHWHDALRALATQDESGAVKVAFGPATSG